MTLRSDLYTKWTEQDDPNIGTFADEAYRLGSILINQVEDLNDLKDRLAQNASSEYLPHVQRAWAAMLNDLTEGLERDQLQTT